MKEHHLQLNLAKTELLVFPATPTLQHDFTIQLGSSTITPSASVINLGVIFDDQLTFKEHIAKTARTGWWNDLLTPHPKCWISVNLQATTENSSLSTLLDFIIKKTFPFSKSSSFSLSLCPFLASLYLFEQCLRLGVMGTSSVCLPLQN